MHMGIGFFSYRSFPQRRAYRRGYERLHAFVAANPAHPFRIAPPNQALQPAASPQPRPRLS
jgi:hypothetical protein